MPVAFQAQSLNPWTTREVPVLPSDQTSSMRQPWRYKGKIFPKSPKQTTGEKCLKSRVLPGTKARGKESDVAGGGVAVLGLLFLFGSETSGLKHQVHGLKSRGAESKIKESTEEQDRRAPGSASIQMYIPYLLCAGPCASSGIQG